MIAPIETIQANAVRAALAGAQACACPFPPGSPQGAAWAVFYDVAADCFEAQLARYARAIGGV
jgi:hypothetical protein